MENIQYNNNNSITYSHIPVLLHEVIDGLSVQPNSWYIDATLGGGGYTAAMVERHAHVLGIDADSDAISFVATRLEKEFPEKAEKKDWILIHDNFNHIEEIAHHEHIQPSGIVFDLGVSSYQIDTKEKGFSYRFADAPLDLRLDQTQGVTAADIINTCSQEELYEIFTKYGEEKRSGTIVDRIISTRRITPIITTGDLRKRIEESVPIQEKDVVSARIFQALRISVNNELIHLKHALESAKHLLLPGGILCVVSFHSLEDRIVKQQFKSDGWIQVTKNPILPSSDEILKNRRSRSAKLRIAKKREL